MALLDVITNDVLAVIVVITRLPVPVGPAGLTSVRNIILLAFTADVVTVTVPPESVAVPIVLSALVLLCISRAAELVVLFVKCSCPELYVAILLLSVMFNVLLPRSDVPYPLAI